MSTLDAATRERLMDAGQVLFGTQGYSATSMRQVAEQTGLALGGIYNHFSSKENLFLSILLERNPFARCSLCCLPDIVDRERAITLLKELNEQPEFFNLILIELLEFKAIHLPRLFEEIFGKTPPSPSWRTLLGVMISYHVTQTLLASALPTGSQPTLSPDALLDIVLPGILKPE